MTGEVGVLRVGGGVRRDPAVEAWFRDEPVELRTLAQKWFLRMRACGGDVLELMHDGCPVACVEDAPFAYVNSYRAHVNVGFFHGASLVDSAGILEGSGKRMRHVKARPGHEPDADAIGDLIEAAYRDIRARLG